MRGGTAVIVSVWLLASLFSVVDLTEWNSDGPTFPLEVSTDKYYYVQGESIRITLLNVGDENITFYVPPDL
jgi:hypothetical protein